MRKIIMTGFVESALSVIIVAILVFGVFNPVYRDIAKICVLITLFYWTALVLFGLLIPYVRHSFSLAFDFNPKENRLGYPIVVSFESRGGFICGNPITVKARVIDAGTDKEKGALSETRKLFRENFSEFSVLWPASRLYNDIKQGSQGPGSVKLNMKKCAGTSAIAFTAPGKQSCCFMYKTKSGTPTSSSPISEEETPNAFIHISAPETIYQLRVMNMVYSLSLVIISLLFLKALW
ncbi:hypothetical protein ACFL4C_00685 [Candidatus Omnitrophota bacterium]